MSNYNQYHKKLTGGSPKHSNTVGCFCPAIKKNDYRSFININFISNIVLHMVAISTFKRPYFMVAISTFKRPYE